VLSPEELDALTLIGEKVAAHFGENCLDYPAQSANRKPVNRS
jgi:hypothetical protein